VGEPVRSRMVTILWLHCWNRKGCQTCVLGYKFHYESMCISTSKAFALAYLHERLCIQVQQTAALYSDCLLTWSNCFGAKQEARSMIWRNDDLSEALWAQRELSSPNIERFVNVVSISSLSHANVLTVHAAEISRPISQIGIYLRKFSKGSDYIRTVCSNPFVNLPLRAKFQAQHSHLVL
jgi:hypothetical protein